MAADAFGQGLAATRSDLGGQAQERARVVAAASTFLDHRSEVLVAVKRGATGPGCGGDSREGDGGALAQERLAGLLDSVLAGLPTRPTSRPRPTRPK